MTSLDTPRYLSGILEPVAVATEARNLEVTGALPPELCGRYLRNGPNPAPGADPGHLWAGPGMLHGIRIRDGRAEWYRNRWIRTTPPPDGYDLFDPARDLSVGTANTHVVPYAGRILALQEGMLPYEVDAELDTAGPYDFGGRLATGMTAHPKVDPDTGELHFFDAYRPTPPHLIYHVASPDGELLRSVPIEVPAVTLMHDFAITQNYVIWFDLPVVGDPDQVGRNPLPMHWSETHEPRIGIMPKHGASADIVWITVDPCWIIHTANAREDDNGRIVLEGNRVVPQGWDVSWARLGGYVQHVPGNLDDRNPLPEAFLHRWTLDPATGTVREDQLDDRAVEFPTINADHTGRASRDVYAVGYPRQNGPDGYELVKYDTVAGTSSSHRFGTTQVPGEADFVAAPGAYGEDEGWLLSLVTGIGTAPSQLVVLDATDFSGPPVARITLPTRVPYGFHASWIPDEP
ncbi:carotenoid oxygenase family protein [Nocardia brasiliensis]|uniref:carotenoid oxygenase family protein n=1 Tax=Nocardia brasiliensis TaxID=37326 RepID=UPI002454A686|nr:carotenoid oxygenase family protein [Nocardia brasiliensis]